MSFKLLPNFWIATLLCLLFTLPKTLHSQAKLTFSKSSNHHIQKRFSNVIEDSKSFSIHVSSLYQVIKNEKSEVQIRFDNDVEWDVTLKRHSLFGDQHKVILGRPSGRLEYNNSTNSVYSYIGKIKENEQSTILLTISNEGIEGMIDDGQSQYYLETIDLDKQKNIVEVILYTPDQVKNKHAQCLFNDVQTKKNNAIKEHKTITNGCIEIRLAIAVDYDYFRNYNSDVSAVISRTMTIMNLVNSDYETAFDNTISFKVVEHFITTCADCQAWNQTTDAMALVESFRHWAEDGGFRSDFELGQLWTGIDLTMDQESGIIGYAFNGGFCSEKRYHVLEDFSETLSRLRVLTSHEIGHNLDSDHDTPGSPTIMSPSIRNTSDWSFASQSAINSFLNASSCIRSCTPSESCLSIEGFLLEEFTPTSLSASWASTGLVRIRVLDEHSLEPILDIQTIESSINITHNFTDCQSLVFEMAVICENADSPKTTIPLGNPSPIMLDVLDASVVNCIPGEPNNYDLQLVLSHNGSVGEIFNVNIDGRLYPLDFDNSPQTIIIESLSSTDNDEALNISISTIGTNEIFCLADLQFNLVPNALCDLAIYEDFNDCAIPYGWTKSSSNQDFFPFPYEWQFNDHTRKTQNYARSTNATRDRTIDGTCMVYFDDDIENVNNFTGILALFTRQYDIRMYENVSLSFTYLFHDFSDIKDSNDDSFFSFQVWTGFNWTEVLRADESNCLWSDVWNPDCPISFSLNIDQYRIEDFRCRFIYSDGNEGDWTGMVAVDNFSIIGNLQQGCTDPTGINYNPNAGIDDGSCFSCQNGLLDGFETAIDCGGPHCTECPVPCPIDSLTINTVSQDSTYRSVDFIKISANLLDFEVSLKPGISAYLEPGFEVGRSYTFSVGIEECN